MPRRRFRTADTVTVEAVDSSSTAAGRKRQLVADFCKLLVSQVSDAKPSSPAAEIDFERVDSTAANELPHLSPRMRQTLDCLLRGDSEKQIAGRLKLSRHTVHVYVKALYKGFTVNSRGELLARFVDRGAASRDPSRSIDR